LSDAELDAKLLELAEPVCGRDRALALLDDLWRIDTLPRLDALGSRGPPGSATRITPTA
jgi:hypothetical protein